MPTLIENYGTYVDLRFEGGNLIQAYSKTALECLGAGLRVLGPTLEYEYKLPEIHKGENVSTAVMEIYKNLLS